MILNMPVTNGATNSPVSQGQNEYTNFLKRKYSEHELDHSPTPENNTNFETNTTQINSNWKKRHIDQELEQSEHYKAHTITYDQTSFKARENHNLTNEHDPSNAVTDPHSGSFNIIANNSSFINDLFAYDANFIVPVSVNNLNDFSSSTSTVCVNSSVEYEDNGEHWQASDLLELDHRYNSSLQTEISQLNPTVNLKTSSGEVSSLQTDLHSSQQSEQFLLPPKPQNQTSSKRLLTTSSNVSTTATSSPSSTCSSSFTTDNLDAECDFEDKNLSWLLNFKFDEFPHLNPDVANLNAGGKNSKSQTNSSYGNMNNATTGFTGSNSPIMSSGSVGQKSQLNQNHASNGSLLSERSKSPKNANKTGKKFEELVMEVTSEVDGNDMIVAENVVIEESSQRSPKKPPFTYTELIEYALEDKGELTVSGIYQWISDRFPYYKSNDDRWKNSVRHNLSINPHFRKGHKAPQGAGHLWTISSGDSAENVLAWEHKKQRLDLFFKMESMNRERLQQHQQKQQQERLLQNGVQHKQHIGCQQDQCLYDEAAVAAAAIQQEMLQQTQNNNDGSIQNQNSLNELDSTVSHRVMHELPYNDLLTDEELRKTAGQILNGIHRDVEVQSVNQTIIGTYQDVLLDNDYLNPIHKDVVVNESGLRHSSHSNISSHSHSNNSSSGPYYVTEIDPMELGIQISNHHQHHHHHQHIHHSSVPSSTVSEESDVVLFNDEFNLNYFSYNPAHDIVA